MFRTRKKQNEFIFGEKKISFVDILISLSKWGKGEKIDRLFFVSPDFPFGSENENFDGNISSIFEASLDGSI